ncbi:MAG TPA: M28 family peptidase [Bryobacteraceae bacterium]|jgi:hypothetical protein|nr:M28 family peptidase [Bryobacteraceae bacterium]
MLRQLILFPLLLTQLPAAEAIHVDLVKPEGIQARLERGVVDSKFRQATIHKLFEEAGCAPEEHPVFRKVANVICRLPGESDSTIIVGGHFDFAEKGQGILDDWSGTALLPSLYEALKSEPRRHTFIFVAFAEEELGLLGSKQYVKEMSQEERSNVKAFVNLECLGAGSTKVWAHRATPALVSQLVAVANSLQIPLGEGNVEKIGDDDSHPFLSAQMPVITLHSLTQETLKIMHSPQDRVKAIHTEEYYSSYKLAAIYLGFLDRLNY